MQIDIINDIIIRKKTARRLREPYSKSLGDGIFEIRAKVGTDITRVLYFSIMKENNLNKWIC